jgi:hypothetical protein
MKKEKRIFELTLIEYRNDKHQYPEFSVFRNKIGIFSSFEEAEQAVNKYEKEYKKSRSRSLYGFKIDEFITKKASEPKILVNEFGYIPDDMALIVDKDTWSKFINAPFLDPGDIVEVLRANKVTLEIISNITLLPEVTKDGSTYAVLNDSRYKTIQSNGKLSRIEKANMFPPRFPVSNELKEKLLDLEENSYIAYCDKIKNKRILANYTRQIKKLRK